MLDSYTTLQSLSWNEAFIRVGLACLFGFVLGFDRSRKNKPIDFRVYMIVSASACLVGMLAQEIQAMYTQNPNDVLQLDLFRVVEGVLTGIGFLGAGAIIRRDDENSVIGSATGASIWGSGIMGLLLGFGLYGLAGLGFLTLAVILILFGLLRQPLFHEKEKYDQ